MRKEILVPASGEKNSYSVSGQSVLIEAAAMYQNPEDVPVIGFNGQTPTFPAYPLATIPFYGKGKINSIEIQGTQAAKDDVVTIITVDECLPLNIQPSFNYSPIAGTTGAQPITDAVFSFDNLMLDLNGKLPKTLYVRAEDTDILYRFNSSPAAGGAESHLLRATEKTADGFIEVQSSASAGETFDITIADIRESVTVANGDTAATIIDKINTALDGNAILSNLFTFTQPKTNRLKVETTTKTDEYNGEPIAVGITVADYQAKPITGGRNETPYTVEIAGIDFILNAEFINKTPGETANLIYTGRY